MTRQKSQRIKDSFFLALFAPLREIFQVLVAARPAKFILAEVLEQMAAG